ncbi:MAG: hypothetical protein OEY66_12010 [Gammaproteobacteria bacterium]|nr:hypothetical protein [Gammaproteobacteria bacterium]
MNFKLCYCFRPALYCCLFVLAASSLSACATNVYPDGSTEDTPVAPVSAMDAHAARLAKQYENRNPEEDARAALAEGDFHLLGFATRATSIPGIAAADWEAVMNNCGVRLMEGFGDVVRSKAELSAARLASSYAKRYNAVVRAECLKP